MSYSEADKQKYALALEQAVGRSAALSAKQRIAEGIRELRALQMVVSDRTPDRALWRGVTPTTIRVYALAMIAEVSELAEAMAGKAWAGDVPESRERILDEFADVTAFYGLLAEIVFQATNASATEVAGAYLTKVGRNLERAAGREAGYEANAPVIDAAFAPDIDGIRALAEGMKAFPGLIETQTAALLRRKMGEGEHTTKREDDPGDERVDEIFQ